jgi:hypothetical protein
MTQDEGLITAYVTRYTQPVQWVNWWYDTDDPIAKNNLHSVLFDAGTESLRDLTTQAVREEVLGVVLSNEALRQIVFEETSQIVDSIANRLSQPPGNESTRI